MKNYRKATLEEIENLYNQLKYTDDINLDLLCEESKELFPGVKYVIVEFNDEYNDSGYDLRPSRITPLDKNEKDVSPDWIKEEEYDNENWDKYSDLKYELEIGSESFDGDRSFGPIKIDVEKKKIINKIDNLYVLEDNN